MCETSLVQKSMDVVFSLCNLGMIGAATGAYSFRADTTSWLASGGRVVTTTFSLKMEAGWSIAVASMAACDICRIIIY